MINKINAFFDRPLPLVRTNIAIVGSSFCIMQNKNGKLIDSHDHVIRFNLAPIEGYEEYVGKREDFRAINDGQYHHFKETNKIHNSKIIFNNPRNTNYGLHRDRYLHASSKVYLLNPKKLSFIKKQCGFMSAKIPSTGMTIIMTFICGGVAPSLFGFDYKPKPYQHYWENAPIPSGNATDIAYEKKLLSQLIANKKVKPY